MDSKCFVCTAEHPNGGWIEMPLLGVRVCSRCDGLIKRTPFKKPDGALSRKLAARWRKWDREFNLNDYTREEAMAVLEAPQRMRDEWRLHCMATQQHTPDVFQDLALECFE